MVKEIEADKLERLKKAEEKLQKGETTLAVVPPSEQKQIDKGNEEIAKASVVDANLLLEEKILILEKRLTNLSTDRDQKAKKIKQLFAEKTKLEKDFKTFKTDADSQVEGVEKVLANNQSEIIDLNQKLAIREERVRELEEYEEKYKGLRAEMVRIEASIPDSADRG